MSYVFVTPGNRKFPRAGEGMAALKRKGVWMFKYMEKRKSQKGSDEKQVWVQWGEKPMGYRGERICK